MRAKSRQQKTRRAKTARCHARRCRVSRAVGDRLRARSDLTESGRALLVIGRRIIFSVSRYPPDGM